MLDFGIFADVLLLVVAVPSALLLGLLAVVAGWRRKRYWRGASISLLGMSSLTLLVFMLWLHVGIELQVAQLAVVGLAILVAVVLSNHVRSVDSSTLVPCPQCQQLNDVKWSVCENCGMILNEAMASELPAFKQGRPAGFRSRMAAFLLDQILLVVLLGTVPILGVSTIEIFPYSDFVVPLALNLLYATVLIGTFRATVGKRVMALYVIRSDGSKVGYVGHSCGNCLSTPSSWWSAHSWSPCAATSVDCTTCSWTPSSSGADGAQSFGCDARGVPRSRRISLQPGGS